jgi:hypothetical protein
MKKYAMSYIICDIAIVISTIGMISTLLYIAMG